MKAKSDKWKNLCEDLENDIWGKGYQIVCKKIPQKPRVNLSKENIVEQFYKLFPTRPSNAWQPKETIKENITLFDNEEIRTAINNAKNKKAPGPDQITSEIIKAFAKKNAESIKHTMNTCLLNGHFPNIWKIATLILIEKPKKSPNALQTYRPICLLNTMGKVRERLIKT